MANVRVNPNLEAEVTGHILGTRRETHGPLERALGLYAEQIAERARQIARVEYYRTGAYARGIVADVGVDDKRHELVGRVVATDWKSHWAEFGWRSRTGGERARHILARAARQVGFEVAFAQSFGRAGGARRAIGDPSRQAIGGRRRAITGR